MANIPESSTFSPDVYKIETTDPVLGGPPTAIANIQAKQLADRTRWLKDKVDAGGFGGGAVVFAGNINTLLNTGWYYATTAASNKPISTEGFVQVMKYVALGYSIQIFYSISTDRTFIRRVLDGPTFGNWVEFASQSSVDSTIGQIAAFAANATPVGWLKANGSTVSRTTYAALFAKIGIVFGPGNGATTFKLPDLRGEFIRGFDDGRGVDTARVFGSEQGHAYESHHHSLQRVIAGGGATLEGYDLGDFVSGVSLGPITTKNVQDFGDVETRPRNVALLYCIKF